MSGFRGKAVVVVGAGGSQGHMAVEMLQQAPDRPDRILALDRRFDQALERSYVEAGIELHTLDILAQKDALEEVLKSADLVLNFAGPFHILGTAVLDAAIATKSDYIDICDDADVASELMALDEKAMEAGIKAVIGAGSAPGITNILGRVALNNLPSGDEPARLSIAWVTPVEDITPSIFSHIQHCLCSAVDGATMPAWPDLEPRLVEFPDPIGAIETILFGHPEPATFSRYLDVEVELRGGSMPSEMMHVAWSLASIVEKSKALGQGDSALAEAYKAYSAAGRAAVLEHEQQGWGGLHIEAWRGSLGVRIQTVSNETMEETTVTPCISIARVLMQGHAPRAGVLSPELLNPGHFFAASISSSDATTRLFAHRIDDTGSLEAVSMRELLAANQFTG